MKKLLLLLGVWMMVGCNFASNDLNATGLKKLHQQNYHGAIEDFNKAIALNENNGVAYYNRGLTKGYIGDTAGALADYDKAISLRKTDKNATLYLAVCYCNRGLIKSGKKNNESAIDDYDEAIHLNPSMGIALFDKAHVEYTLNEYDKAIIDFTKAIEIAKTDTYANQYYSFSYMCRGVCLYQQHKYDEAFANLDTALIKDPKNTLAQYNKAVFYYERGNYADAAENFNLLTKQPKYAVVNYYLAMIDIKNGYKDIARGEMNKAKNGGLPGMADTIKKYFP